MSHIVIKCSGCDSKLRFRADTGRTQIECPRCGEILQVPQVEAVEPESRQRPAPARPTAERPSRPAAPQRAPAPRTPTAADGGRVRRAPPSPPVRRSRAVVPHDEPEDYVDEDELRARRETKLLFVGLAAAAFVALIVFPGAFLLLRDRGAEQQVSTVPDETPPNREASPTIAQAPAASVPAPSGVQSPSGDPSTIPAPADPAAQSPEAERTTPPPRGSMAAAVEPPPPNLLPSTPPTQATAPPIVQPAPQAPATVAASADDARLRYAWKPGDEHVYQITIEADFGDEKKVVNGSCIYTVKGSAAANVVDEEGSGTGFVVGADGYIATCAHVVEGAKDIQVEIGGRTWSARVIAEKPREDLALLRIDAQNLPVLALGDSDRVQLAEDVRAIGFPLSDVLGTGVKVTSGTIAGILNDSKRGRRLQVDAPINPGNSGGPVVNGSGQVVGVASAKLSGSSVSSVGFAVPVNELRALLQANGLGVPVAAPQAALAGTEVARRVTPAVAYIKVRGSSGAGAFDIGFSASFTESSRSTGNRIRFGGLPSFPSSSSDQGTLRVDTFGEITEFSGEEHLPFVLGPIGRFFIEPLDPYGAAAWQTEIETTLHRIERGESGPGIGPRGFGGPRFRPPGFGPRFGPGGFSPFAEPEEKTIETIPAIERSSYTLGQELNNRVTIRKQYEFTTTRNQARPYMKIRGQGDLVFDKQIGMPVSLEYSATLEQNDDGDETARLPLKISWLLRDPQDVRQEREAARQRMEEQKQQQEHERTVPNADLVDSLLDEIRKAEGGIRAFGPLKRLAEIAVVEDKRERVLQVVNNHRRNSNNAVRMHAAEAFCNWATPEYSEEIQAILSDSDASMFSAKRAALKKLASLNQPDAMTAIINATAEGSLRNDAKNALIEAGEAAEDAVLKNMDSLTDDNAKSTLIEVLQKIGTKKSIRPLEQVQNSGNNRLKYAAERALDAIRARL